MKIEHLKCFLAVAKYGSINKAAKELFTSQPSLSAIIHSLESEIGHPLFERTTNGVVLTELGKKVQEDAQLIIYRVESWKNPFLDDQNIEANIKISAYTAAGHVILPDCIGEINKAFPHIKIDVVSNTPNATLSKLSKDSFDISLIAFRSDSLAEIQEHIDKYHKLDVISKENLMAYVSKENIFSQKDHISINELKDYVVVSNTLDEFPYINHLKALGFKNFLNIDSIFSAMNMVAKNLAITFYPKMWSLNNYYINNNQITLLPLEEELSLSYGIIYNSTEFLSPAEKIVVNAIKHKYLQYTT